MLLSILWTVDREGAEYANNSLFTMMKFKRLMEERKTGIKSEIHPSILRFNSTLINIFIQAIYQLSVM